MSESSIESNGSNSANEHDDVIKPRSTGSLGSYANSLLNLSVSAKVSWYFIDT